MDTAETIKNEEIEIRMIQEYNRGKGFAGIVLMGVMLATIIMVAGFSFGVVLIIMQFLKLNN